MRADFDLPDLAHERVDAFVRTAEQVLGVRLQYRVTPRGELEPIEDAPAWIVGAWPALSAATAWGEHEDILAAIIFVTNGVLGDAHVGVSVAYGPPTLPTVGVTIDFPGPQAFDLLAAVGSASAARWGETMPPGAGLRIAGLVWDERRFEPKQIGAPTTLAWIGYWSLDVCAELGFSAADERARLFARVLEIEGHGLVWQLTADPLDLSRPEHMDALTAVYEAFR